MRRPSPGPEFKYATAIWRNARGPAFAALGQVEEARREPAGLDALAASATWNTYVAEIPTVPLTKMVEVAPLWPTPGRWSLGATLLAQGKAKEAEAGQVYGYNHLVIGVGDVKKAGIKFAG